VLGDDAQKVLAAVAENKKNKGKKGKGQDDSKVAAAAAPAPIKIEQAQSSMSTGSNDALSNQQAPGKFMFFVCLIVSAVSRY
jgi:hypothetical protein